MDTPRIDVDDIVELILNERGEGLSDEDFLYLCDELLHKINKRPGSSFKTIGRWFDACYDEIQAILEEPELPERGEFEEPEE